jgi:ERCC4-type nuclease
MKKEFQKLSIICDTREQQPLYFPEHVADISRQKLDYGDYSLFDDILGIERKSLDDLVNSITQTENFRRLKAELQRMEDAGSLKLIVVEGSISNILRHEYNAMVNSTFVIKRICQLILAGVQVLFCEDPGVTAFLVYKILQEQLESKS